MSTQKVTRERQFTDYHKFNPSKIIKISDFDTGKFGTRCRINVVYPSGNLGPLIFDSPMMFAKGVYVDDNGTHSVPFFMQDKDQPTEDQIAHIHAWEKLHYFVKKWIVDNLEPLKKINGKLFKKIKSVDDIDDTILSEVMWRPTNDDGEIDESASPIMFCAKLIEKKGDEPVIYTKFFDQNNNRCNPLDFEGSKEKPFYFPIEPALQIESIWIGKKVSIQVKIAEANVVRRDPTEERRMKKPLNPTEFASNSDPSALLDSDDEGEEEMEEVPEKKSKRKSKKSSDE